MAYATLDDRHQPTTRLIDRFHALALAADTEALMDALDIDAAQAATLAAMGALERAADPLRPFGLAGDATIALEAHLGLFEARRALAWLWKRGLAEPCVGHLRWSLTDDGRARLASTTPTQEPTP